MQKNINDLLKLYTATKQTISITKVDTNKVRVPKMVADIYSPGDSYQYILNLHTEKLDFVSPSVTEILGIELETFQPKNILEHIHPNDKQHFLDMEVLICYFYELRPSSEILFYKRSYQYRLKTKSGHYELFLQQTTTLSLDEEKQFHKVFCNHSKINHITKANNRCLSVLGMEGRPSYYNIKVKSDFNKKEYHRKQYSTREIQILHLISLGKSSKEIAEELFISYDTVRTHRQNIIAKSTSKNMLQIITEAIREGVI